MDSDMATAPAPPCDIYIGLDDFKYLEDGVQNLEAETSSSTMARCLVPLSSFVQEVITPQLLD